MQDRVRLSSLRAISRPRVTVVVPTYNRECFIALAVESVVNQSVQDWELIIVDDGSTDQTTALLDSWLTDPRIHYLYQSNQGQSAARNRGLAAVNSDYIGFLDSDDIWLSDKLEKQLAIFDRCAGVDIVHGDEIVIDEVGRVLSKQNMARYSGFITPQLLSDNCVSMTTALVRRGCFEEMGGFDESDRVAEDYELWLRFSTRYRFYYEPGYVTLYRSMADQLSTDTRLRLQANEHILNTFLNRFPSAVTPAERRTGLSRFHTRKARYLASAGCRAEAIRAIFEAFCLKPFDRGVWRGMYRVCLPK